MIVVGVILLLIGGLGCLAFSLAALAANWRYSPGMTLMTFIPVVGIFPSLYLLIYNWHEVKGPILGGILMMPLLLVGSIMTSAGMGPIERDNRRTQNGLTAADQDLDAIQRKIERESTQWRTTPPPMVKMPDTSGIFGHSDTRHNTSRTSRNTPPPPPDEPIFEPDQLVAGLPNASALVADWPTLTVPDLDLSNGKALDLHGYQLMVPDIYKIDRVEPLKQGNGMQWTIVGGLFDNGRPVELKVRVTALPQQADGRVFESSWSEVLGQAGVSRTNYRIEYGQIGAIPFARCANKLVKSGHGVGQVRYLGKPSPQNPQRIEIEFATDPQGFGRAHALTCEAIVRSLTCTGRVMMPELTDTAAISSPLASPTTAEISPSDWQVRGPFALAVSDQSKATCSPWSRDGQAWQTTARFSGAGDCAITIKLQPDDDIPANRVRRIALEGPLRADAVVCAYGGEASYVKLWNDTVFARVEHTSLRAGDASSHHLVSYHGYFNQNRLDITVTNRADSEVTMAELEDTLLRSRLAAVPELAQQAAQAEWLKEVLADDQPAFVVAGGVDATQALLINEQGAITVSPQYDAESQRMFAVYPPDDAQTLADYEPWSSDESHDERLGKAETLGEIVIQPIKELRASHQSKQLSKQLSWQTKTKAGSVGMTVHLEDLKVSDREIQTPIVEVGGRLRIRLGRRVIKPSQTPEVSYRELRNLRIWRVNVPASARQSIARCHYLALVPDKMIVISVSYHADRPDQLDAFDASVATLVYKDGEALEREIPAE